MTTEILQADETAREITEKIGQKVRDEQELFDRMDADFDLWTLKKWQPGMEESVAAEDSYTSNAPRVLATKIIAFISGTELVVRIPNDAAPKPQEELNDAAEMLAIGMLRHADERLRRRGSPSVKDAMAFYTVVRGRYAAIRSLLRKDEVGQTFIDMLPLDPRHLVIEMGDEEPIWAAYRHTFSRAQIRKMFPGFEFEAWQSDDDLRPEELWGYYEAFPNPFFNPSSLNPFERRKSIYLAGTLLDNRFIRPLHDVFALRFPVIAVPVDPMPWLTPTEKSGTLAKYFGESVFAEDRDIWPIKNRITSYAIDNMAKAADPRTKVRSSDGTLTLEEGATEKGAEIALSTANQEDVENFQEADLSRSAAFAQSMVSQDEVAGSLPPQAFGLLDKPLSAVALRQLGNNLEHRVMPRMKALASAVELSLANMLDQYETGGFQPFPVSGRLVSGTQFASKVIEPNLIIGHDPLEVSMQLALPEDLGTIWSVAQMAVAPTGPGGEPLASMEYAREKILRLPSHKVMRNQNIDWLAKSSDPLSQTLEQFKALIEEGDMEHASIIYDKLQVLALQRQVEGSMMLAQLSQAAAGLGIMPGQVGGGVGGGGVGGGISQNGNQNNARLNRQSANPAMGANPGVAERRGMGNQPSPEAGFNTTAARNGNQGDVAARMAALGLEMG